MVIFTSDDLPYRRWLAANPAGYVLNCCIDPANRECPKLHRTTCRSINSPRLAQYSAADYYKACAANAEELERYAQTKFGRLNVCAVCNPYGEMRLQ